MNKYNENEEYIALTWKLIDESGKIVYIDDIFNTHIIKKIDNSPNAHPKIHYVVGFDIADEKIEYNLCTEYVGVNNRQETKGLNMVTDLIPVTSRWIDVSNIKNNDKIRYRLIPTQINDDDYCDTQFLNNEETKKESNLLDSEYDPLSIDF